MGRYLPISVLPIQNELPQMLTAKNAVVQAVSILGRSASISEQLGFLKSYGVDRDTKDLIRQCLITASNFQSTSKENLEKSKTIVRKAKESCEVSSRSAAFAAASALKLKRWGDVDEMLSFSKCCPPVIYNSIRVSSLSQQMKLDEALQELENVLMLEEAVFNSENYCLSDESLDSLCEAIKSEPSSVDKMKRFRNLQRLVTKYKRRTSKSIEELLFSPIKIQQNSFKEMETEKKKHNTIVEFANSESFEKFVKDIPYNNK